MSNIMNYKIDPTDKRGHFTLYELQTILDSLSLMEKQGNLVNSEPFAILEVDQSVFHEAYEEGREESTPEDYQKFISRVKKRASEMMEKQKRVEDNLVLLRARIIGLRDSTVAAAAFDDILENPNEDVDTEV